MNGCFACAQKDGEIRELKAALRLYDLDLSPKQARIVRALLNAELLDADGVAAALRSASYSTSNIHSRMSLLRARLGLLNIKLRIENGRGWYLDRETKQRLLNPPKALAVEDAA